MVHRLSLLCHPLNPFFFFSPHLLDLAALASPTAHPSNTDQPTDRLEGSKGLRLQQWRSKVMASCRLGFFHQATSVEMVCNASNQKQGSVSSQQCVCVSKCIKSFLWKKKKIRLILQPRSKSLKFLGKEDYKLVCIPSLIFQFIVYWKDTTICGRAFHSPNMCKEVFSC